MSYFGQFCRKGCAMLMLTLVFACSAFAGEILQPKTSPPPTENGGMQHAAVDSVTEFAVNVLQSALSLF